MKTSNSKKRFVLSLVVTIVSIAMLVGATFAWFTDSVTSGKNIIKSGNLAVGFEYADGKEDPATAQWTDAKDATIFNYEKWEPGYAQVNHIKISNKGSLALKYKASIVVDGEVSKLAEVLDVYVFPTATQVTDRSALADTYKIGTLKEVLENASLDLTGNLMPAGTEGKTSENTLTIAVKMQEEAENEYQGLSIGNGFTVVVNATQYTYEEDSFDNQYDITAPWLGGIKEVIPDADGIYNIACGEELAWIAQKVNSGDNLFIGETVKLVKDIDLNNVSWTPIGNGANGFKGTFDGQNHTVINLVTSGDKNVGLFGYVFGGTVKNLNVDGATVNGINAVGTVCGLAYYANIENCSVKNATVTASVKNNDDGDKVGGVVGRLSVEEGLGSVKNCSVENVTVQGLRQVGGVLGGAYKTSGSYEVSGNSAKNSTIICDMRTTYSEHKSEYEDVHEVIGTPEALNESSEKDNVKIVVMYNDGLYKDANGNYSITNTAGMVAFADMVNDGNNLKNKIVNLLADIDLNGIDWTPIGRGGKRFEGTFDGQNHTIKNLNSVLDSTSGTQYGNGLFGDITGGATLKDFTVDNAMVYDKVDGKGNVYGIVCGYAYGTVTFENITVKNSQISAFGKVAAILGMAADSSGTTTIKNCNVQDTEITGAYNCAIFAGLTQNTVSMSGNTKSSVTFKYSSRYSEDHYTNLDTTAANGDKVNGKYWMYANDAYYAAWAEQYNEQKGTTINEGAIAIDAIVHN